jgi:branched-chain amino acid transport system permease protein
LGGESGNTIWGLGLPIWIWLPAAGLVAAAIGIAVAPTAVRVRGLYLAFVTLGLVFIGQYLWRNLGKIAGGPTTGRDWPPLEFALWRGDPIISFASDGAWANIELIGEAKVYYFLLGVVIISALLAKNLMRTRVGRSWASIRDRDIAAEVMGVAEAKGKTQAFDPGDVESPALDRVHRHHPHRRRRDDHRDAARHGVRCDVAPLRG